MTGSDFLQIGLLFAMILLLAVPYGRFMAKVYSDEDHILKTPLHWLETLTFKACGINPMQEMGWRDYVTALLLFNAFGFIALLGIQLFQNVLPLNTESLPAVPGWLAINTAVSFVTNTNWQAYSGEAVMSQLTQMFGLGVQNFLSAATGMAVAVCFARGLSQTSSKSVGNFWTDCVRSIIYILLPLSLLLAILLASQGVVQNFSSYIHYKTIEGLDQILPMGPAASQIAIKQLGSNGGGYFGVNSAHPFENPTALSNFLELFAILFIPVAMPIAFGYLVGSKKHGIALLISMTLLFGTGLALSFYSESVANHSLALLHSTEGQELRFGSLMSTLWTVATSATSNGSVNAMISSLTPLTGGLAMLNIMLGEVVFGGVGSGLYGIALFVVVTVFIAGLMVGRTPEYLGKKIEAQEIQLAMIAILVPSILILSGSAIACISESGMSSVLNKGPHGLSEILYAFSSAAGNNGSAFAGLNANTTFYNSLLALAMFVGRFAVIVPALAIAGRLAAKKKTPPSSGTFPVDSVLFVTLLVSTIAIVGALTFLPALSLGPIVEQFLMTAGRTF